MQLAQPHVVRVLDDQRIDVGDVDSGLDNGGADQHVDLTLGHTGHHVAELALGHLAVGRLDGNVLAQQVTETGGGGIDAVHPIVQVIHLSAPAQLPADGIRQKAPVVLQHIGLDALAVLGRLLDGAHVADAGHGHVQRPGNRRSREGQGVHLSGHLTQTLLVGDAEALLLVDDEQTQVFELHALAQQLMGADKQVHTAILHPFQHILDLLGGAEAGQHLHRDREGPKPGGGSGIVLLRQHGGGHQQRHLLAVQDALHGGAEGHLRLAVAHVAAEQPVHGHGFLHIGLDLPDGSQLIVGLRIVEGLLKFLLPGGIR